MRKDITNLYLLHPSVFTSISIKLDSKWLNTPLTSTYKNELANEINLLDTKGRLRKWNTIKHELINNGYEIENNSIRLVRGDRKQTRVTVISESEG